MKKQIMRQLLLPASLTVFGALSLVSCQDEDFGYEAKDITYQNEFKKVFGNPDPEQNWSMATRVVANVNVPNIKGTSRMRILTGSPKSPASHILAQIQVQDGQASVAFDGLKGLDKVYVTIEQDKAYKLYGEYAIVDGVLQIGNTAVTRAFSESCPTTLGEEVEVKQISFLGKDPQAKSIQFGNDNLTFDEWVEKVNSGEKYGYGQYNKFNQSPFTTASMAHFVKITKIDWENATLVVDEAHTLVDADGKLAYCYNGVAQSGWNSGYKTADEWKTIIDNDHGKIGSECPWTTESILAASEYEDIEVDDFTKIPAGAIYVGLYAPSNWKVKSNATPMYEILHPKWQYLNNVEKNPATAWNRGFGYSLFGPSGMFEEREAYYGDKKRALYGDNDLATMEKDFVIRSTGGPITLPYIFGCTAFADQFGYIYWKDGEDVDPLTLPHYVLMEDARPSSNIYFDEYGKPFNPEAQEGMENDGMNSALSNWNDGFQNAYDNKDGEIKCYCSEQGGTGIYSSEGKHLDDCQDPAEEFLAQSNKQVFGTEYRLVFFDPETGEATYNFPAGYKIAFFIDKLGSVADLTAHKNYEMANYNYSMPSLNKRIHSYSGEKSNEMTYDNSHHYTYTGSPTYNDHHNETNDQVDGMVKTIAWVIDDVYYLGFGDNSGDHDLNDIVFIVDGNFVPDNIVEVAPIKWHLNIEGVHMEDDSDLFDLYNFAPGKQYAEPQDASGTSREPVWPHRTFLGWSTSPDNSTGDMSKTISDIVPTGGKCYYAIWDVTPLPEPMSWIFACEDLGGTYDYDFNDVVWEVTKVWDEDWTATVTVKVLAAGGTMPFTVNYDGNKVCTKTEAFEGEYTDEDVVNAGYSEGKDLVSKEFELTLDDAAAWLITDNYTKFSITVKGASGTFVIKNDEKGTKENNVPQILVAPGEWEWPTEETNINEAYPNFKDWAVDATWTDWSANKEAGKTVSR